MGLSGHGVLGRAALGFLCFCVFAGLAFPQPGDSTVQVGYMIVTPVFGDANSLQVVETFGLNDGFTTAQGSIAPPILSNAASLLVNIDQSILRDVGVAMANPGGTDASVTLTLRNSLGFDLVIRNAVVNAGRQVAAFVTQLLSDVPALSQSFTGTLTIQSDKPLGISALRFRGSFFGNLPVNNLLPSSAPFPTLSLGGIGGPGAVLLPQFATGGGWSSQIMMSNSSLQSISVNVNLFGQDGLPLPVTLNNQTGSSFSGITIPSGGVVILSTPPGPTGVPAF